uniref:Cas12h1 n=1 Tax=unidentified TaxID=32644 RepID=UPI0021EEEB36
MKVHEIPRSQLLKIKQYEGSFVEWYRDLQEDRKKFASLLFRWAAFGYAAREDDGATYISPSQALLERRLLLGDAEDVAIKFLDVLFKGGAPSSSCYSLFYEDFALRDKAKYSGAKREFIEGLATMPLDKIIERIRQDEQLSKIPAEEWLILGAEYSPEEIWEQVAPRIVNVDRSLGKQLRERLGIKCRRPHDAGYCKILMEVVARQLRSHNETYHEYLNQTHEMKTKVANNLTNEFDLVCEFAEVLEEKNYGLGWYVLWQGVKQALKEQKKPTKIQIAVDQLRQPKFAGLLTAKWRALKGAYDTWKLKKRLEKRKAFPYMPNWDNDYQIPVGLTGLGVFTLEVKRTEVVVDLKEHGKLFCSHSHYFGDLTAEKHPSRYHLKFRHKLKLRKRDSRVEPTIGPWIEAALREITIQKKPNGVFYLGLPYALSHGIDNFQIAKRFFSAAKPDKEVINGLPSEMVVGAADLNLSNIVAPVKARIGKGLEGPLHALDYGYGELIDGPKILTPDGPRCGELISLKRDIVEIKSAIKEFKACQREGLTMSEETTTWLSEVESPSDSPRCMIQSRIADTSRRLNSFKYQMNKEGYQDLAEALRLLDAMDSYNSLLESYQRMHLSPGEQSPKEAKFDTKRASFRDLLRRRVAHTIVEYFDDCDIVFFEDLDGPSDSDSRNNALVKLLSPRTLLLYIRQALEKRGIGMVEVAKDGTSQNNPISGHVGWRNKQNKSEIYFYEDKELLVMDADEVGAMNILCRGLNHSVCPYSFVTKAPEKKNDEKKEGDYGKRVKRFLKDRYGSSNVRFLVASMGFVTVTTKRPKDALVGKRLYYHGGELVTHDLHNRMKDEIKYLVEKEVLARRVSLSDSTIKSYKSFAHV